MFHSPHSSDEMLATRRTHMLLRSALFQLLASTPFEKITMTELCSEAMIPRSTFYRHFEDKYDLQRYSLQCLLAELHFNDDVLYFRSPDSIREFLIALIQMLEQDLDHYRKVYQTNQDGVLMKMIREYMIQIVTGMLRESEQKGCRFKIDLPIFATMLTDFYFSTLQSYLVMSKHYDMQTFVDNVCLFTEKDFFAEP